MIKSKNDTLLKSAILSALVGLVVYCGSVFAVSTNSSYEYGIELWSYGQSIFVMFYPLLCTAPLCWLMFYEKKDGFLNNIHNRINLDKYIFGKHIKTVLLSGIGIFIASFASLLFASAIANGHVSQHPSQFGEGVFLGAYQINNSTSYGLLLSLWRMVLAGLYASMGFLMSLISRNIFVVLSAPFVYSIIENFATAILDIPGVSILTSFYPNRLDLSHTSVTGLLTGPAVLLIVNIALFIYYKTKIRNDI